MKDPGAALPAHLIVVAGHAVYLGRDGDRPEADSSWALEPYQAGEPPFYIEHIRAGVALAAADPHALLVFSGGQTRRQAGPRSEAQGYLELAHHCAWWSTPQVAARATVEEFARDSFENLLFGICRFWECAGRFPETVSVVSWRFKEVRYGLHREAIRWPASRFRYYGVNQPPVVEGVRGGEAATRAAFEQDPFGAGAALGAKRATRDPFARRPPYTVSCPDLVALLRHRGPAVFDGPLPWA